MPCKDSSSSISFRVDHDERFLDFDFAKITCGRAITAETGYSQFCRGKSLEKIVQLSFEEVNAALRPKDEESQFILYLEWECLRAAAAQYLGIDDPWLDAERCQITSVEHTADGVEVSQVILPPKELPKILPCSLANDN